MDKQEHLERQQEGRRIHHRRQTPLERFWSHVSKGGPIFQGEPCWPWRNSAEAAKRDKNQAYGHLNWNGKYQLAHRVSLEIAGVAIPPHLVVDHMCQRAYCVNPAHLRFVTRRVNALENNGSPLAHNARIKACPKGHPYTAENTAISPSRSSKGESHQRTCLTCWPNRWKHAVIERKPPGRSKLKWLGPSRPFELPKVSE